VIFGFITIELCDSNNDCCIGLVNNNSSKCTTPGGKILSISDFSNEFQTQNSPCGYGTIALNIPGYIWGIYFIMYFYSLLIIVFSYYLFSTY
jgi:hypothetical protein